MPDDKILRQRICEEILAYGESKREGTDLTLTIDRILTVFELLISALSSQPDEKMGADNKAVQLVEAYLREAYHDDTETPHFTAWAIDILSLAAPIMAARVEQAKTEEWGEIAALLDIYQNDLGFCEISNHVAYSAWQALKGEQPKGEVKR